MKNSIPIIIISLLMSSLCFSQNADSEKYIYIIPGEHYKAGSVHNFFFGKHWRDVWTTKIKVPVLDLDKFAGGLIPIKKGGGFQTKSLRLKGNDGHIWKFRSIEKDPSKAIPPDLRESLADDILQDQISSSFPFAPLVVATILESAGVLQSIPHLYFMPDSKKLEKYRSEFGGILGFLEIHPDVDLEAKTKFKGAEKIASTFKLFKRLRKKRKEKVNATEYLKARLIDLLVGDWDRHTDQWKWALYKQNGKRLWLPIPRDRDQAFAKFDGLLPNLAETIVPQFNNFGSSFQNIKYLTWNGRFVDRHFLTEITKSKWDSVTIFVKNKITDLLIQNAVKNLPVEIFPLAADEIAEKLKMRRNQLTKISNEFYNLINSVVEIYCTDKNDTVIIERISNSETSVKVTSFNNKSRLKYENPIYKKTFDNNLTKEIWVYLLNGDDHVEVNGVVDKSPVVRIIGGKGKDSVSDNSIVNGNLLGILPIETIKNNCFVYDSGKKTIIKFGEGTVYDDEKIKLPKDDESKYRPLQKSRGSLNYEYPIIKYSSDNGLYLGGGILFFKYGFRAVPFQSKLNANVLYATNPGNTAFQFTGKFNSIIKHATVNLELKGSGLEFTKYYGYGNQTAFSSTLEDNDFYKLEQKLFVVKPSIDFYLSKNAILNFGVSFSYSKSELENVSLLNLFPDKKYGLGNFSLIKISAEYTYDTRDNINNSREGIFLNLKGNFAPKLFSNLENFTKFYGDVRYYFTFKPILKTTLAFRGRAEKVFGKHPFLESSFLGGAKNLLGYGLERFSGNSSIMGTIDSRTMLGDIKLFINGKFGFHYFGSVGRVFARNEISDKWHSSFGGGFWISYLNRQLNIVITLAHSSESNKLYGGFAFGF